MKRLTMALSGLCAAAVLLGCNSPPTEDTVTVRGKVLQNGQPVSGPTKEQITPTPEKPPEYPPEYFAVRFTKLGGEREISYGETIVLQGGVFEHNVPLGKYRVEVLKQKGGGPGGMAMGGMSAEPGAGAAGGGGQPLVTQEVEITQDGQEITLQIGGGGDQGKQGKKPAPTPGVRSSAALLPAAWPPVFVCPAEGPLEKTAAQRADPTDRSVLARRFWRWGHFAVGHWASRQGTRRPFELGRHEPGGRLQLVHPRAAEAGSDPTSNNDDASGRLPAHPGGVQKRGQVRRRAG